MRSSDLEHHRHRPIVDQRNTHAGSEDALLGARPLAETVVQRLGLIARRGLDVAGPGALLGVGVVLEIADAENLARREARSSFRRSHRRSAARLLRQSVSLTRCRPARRQQHQHAGLTATVSLHVDSRLADALDQRSQRACSSRSATASRRPMAIGGTRPSESTSGSYAVSETARTGQLSSRERTCVSSSAPLRPPEAL